MEMEVSQVTWILVAAAIAMLLLFVAVALFSEEPPVGPRDRPSIPSEPRSQAPKPA
jgi:hypothetical protein